MFDLIKISAKIIKNYISFALNSKKNLNISGKCVNVTENTSSLCLL